MILPTLTWEFYRLAIDDKVGKLWCNLSAFLFILRKIKFFSQLHVIHLARGKLYQLTWKVYATQKPFTCCFLSSFHLALHSPLGPSTFPRVKTFWEQEVSLTPGCSPVWSLWNSQCVSAEWIENRAGIFCGSHFWHFILLFSNILNCNYVYRFSQSLYSVRHLRVGSGYLIYPSILSVLPLLTLHDLAPFIFLVIPNIFKTPSNSLNIPGCPLGLHALFLSVWPNLPS